MPLVRIDSSPAHEDETLAAFGDVVHQALVDTIGVPEDDFFQVITRHEAGQLRYDPGYLGVSRDDGVVFVGITLRGGAPVRAEEGALRQDRGAGEGAHEHRAAQHPDRPHREPAGRLVLRRGRGAVPGLTRREPRGPRV
ncbi:hypothetical protein GCM10017788_30580 [Amycolatopsis acidiphila]|nr:hypothetical protein GCM10017788_30580 [Amycolatopsis acidiphila]